MESRERRGGGNKGMTRLIGMDTGDKDYFCLVCGHINKNGAIIIDKVKCTERREVRKRMAIDYRVEWEKLRKKCGRLTIIRNGITTLEDVMQAQINAIIESREKLMQEYVKAQIDTEIIGADRGYHTVKLEVFGESRGTIPVSKNAFNTWIRNKKKGGK